MLVCVVPVSLSQLRGFCSKIPPPMMSYKFVITVNRVFFLLYAHASLLMCSMSPCTLAVVSACKVLSVKSAVLWLVAAMQQVSE